MRNVVIRSLVNGRNINTTPGAKVPNENHLPGVRRNEILPIKNAPIRLPSPIAARKKPYSLTPIPSVSLKKTGASTIAIAVGKAEEALARIN